VAPGTVD